MVKLSIIKIKYFGKRLIKKTSILTNNLGKLCHVSFAIFGSVMSYIGLFYIWSGSLPKIAIFTWLGYPFNFLAGFIGISAAATALTTLGAFVMFLSTHQLVSKKTQYSPEEAQFTFFQQITFALLLIVTSGLIFFHPPLYPYMVVATILTTLLTTIVSSLVFSAKICITASKPIGGSSSSELFETQANTTNLKINDSNLELNADNNDTKNNQIGASISPEEKKNR